MLSLTQQEFENLINLKKKFETSEPLHLDESWMRNILSIKTRDAFILDYTIRGPIELKKYTYNKRYKKIIILLRYDSFGRHTNPDGVIFEGSHIHIYREGFDDKFAFPIEKLGVSQNSTREEILELFLKYCHVVEHPNIQYTIL